METYLSTEDASQGESSLNVLLKGYPNAPFLFALLLSARVLSVKNRERVSQLEQRVRDLESRPLQKWSGPHVTGTHYPEASLVTRSGSLWTAVKATTETPGSSGDWRLIVKRGSYDTSRG